MGDKFLLIKIKLATGDRPYSRQIMGQTLMQCLFINLLNNATHIKLFCWYMNTIDITECITQK